MLKYPRKIVFLHHAGGQSGADISLLSLMKGLQGHGIQCLVACTKTPNTAIPFFESHGFEAVACETRFFPHTTGGWYPVWSVSGIIKLSAWRLQYRKASLRLQELLKNIRPDIVHLNSLTLAPYLSSISSSKIPAVLHVREQVHPGTFGGRKNWLKKMILRHASAVIYICHHNRHALTGEHPIGRVIYNPVDFQQFDRKRNPTQQRASLGLSEKDQVILFLGGSALDIKGVMPLLRALLSLRQRYPHFRCILLGAAQAPSSELLPKLLRTGANACGIFSPRQQVARFIARHHVEDWVIPLPFMPNPEVFYALADVVAVPFIQPHFARQILEAGAMGKPVVASRIGGITEVVSEGKTGFLVPPGNETSLANRLLTVLKNSEMAKSMGNAAYSIARENYEREVSVNKVLDIYASL